MPTTPATDPTTDLYAAWRAALADHDARDTAATHAAEQQAWDALRDACEDAYPHGVCPHPECPQTPTD